MQDKNQRYSTPEPVYKEAEVTRCVNCQSPLPPSASSPHGNVVACFECFTFNNRPVPTNKEDLVKNGKTLTTPDGLDIIASEDQLDIRYSHFKSASKSKLVFLTIFNLIWNGIIFVVAYNAIQEGALVPLLFMSLHILSGIVMFLAWAREVLNYTDVIVRSDYVSVHTGPIRNPFAQRHELRPGDIKQLYTSKKLTSTTNGHPNYQYQLWAIRYDRTKVKLAALASYENVVYIERSIEQYLDITDQRIHGEYEG